MAKDGNVLRLGDVAPIEEAPRIQLRPDGPEYEVKTQDALSVEDFSALMAHYARAEKAEQAVKESQFDHAKVDALLDSLTDLIMSAFINDAPPREEIRALPILHIMQVCDFLGEAWGLKAPVTKLNQMEGRESLSESSKT